MTRELVVERKGLHHTVQLDETLHRLAHLFVSRATAHELKPMGPYGLTVAFRIIGIGPSTLRADRIFDEATHTSDAVTLMNVFGIGVTTAVRYVRAAHPTRFDLDPTSE